MTYQTGRNATAATTVADLAKIGLQTETLAFELDSENGRVGLLLSSKAIVQLLLNPLVGVFTAKVGYHLPLFVGNTALLMSALCKSIFSLFSFITVRFRSFCKITFPSQSFLSY